MKRYGITALLLCGLTFVSFGIIMAEEKALGDACPATSQAPKQSENENITCVYSLDNISSFIYHSKQEHFQMGRDGNAIANAAKELGIRQKSAVQPSGQAIVSDPSSNPIATDNNQQSMSSVTVIDEAVNSQGTRENTTWGPARRRPRPRLPSWNMPLRNTGGTMRCDPSTIDMDIKIEVIEKGGKNQWHKMKATYKNIKMFFWDDNISLKYDISDSKDCQSAWNDLYAAVCMDERDRDSAFMKGDMSYAARALNFRELIKTLSYAVLNNRSFLFELKPDGTEIKITNINDIFEASLICLSQEDANYDLLKEIIRTDAINNIKSVFPPVKSDKYKTAKMDNRVLKYDNISKENKDNAKNDKTKVISSQKKATAEKLSYCPARQIMLMHEGNTKTYDTEMDNRNWTDCKEWRTYSVNLVEVKK